jgi:RNA polymerase sigma-70 factor (ECF subfamily)
MEAITHSSGETRFRRTFEHLGDVVAYAKRRGSLDPEGIAAESMTIAWRKLADVPEDDPRPWLYATARNLLYAEWRQRGRLRGMVSQPADQPAPVTQVIDAELAAALRTLSVRDREVLFLVAWEDLTPALAARSLGLSQGAFRVRLHRARRRLAQALEADSEPVQPLARRLEVEER